MSTGSSRKSNAVLGSIKEHLKHVSIIVEPTEDEFKNDRKQRGDSKEYTVSQFIQAYFPQDFFVRKGPIYSKDDCSNEIDTVLLFPTHPHLITPKRSVIIAEGVYAAIEVKPDISTLTDGSQFHIGLKQIQSVKQLNREVDINISARRPFGLHNDSTLKASPVSCFPSSHNLRIIPLTTYLVA